MAHKDVREFADALLASKEMVLVEDEVDWDQELAGIGRLSCEKDGPAFMFNNVKDYAGWRVMANPVTGWRRFAVALGLPAETPLRELYRVYGEREQNPIPPILVNESPCKEVIWPEEKLDLFDLPVPMVHDGDGGRYLGTWDLVVSKDRDTSWVNWGMYRFMIHNEQLLTGYPRPNSHLGKMLLDGYVPHGETMPIAIVIGADLPSHLSSTATFLLGGDEVELVGLHHEPRKVVATSLEMFHKILDYAEPGDAVGVLLRGVERDDIERGQVLAAPGSIKPHTYAEAEIYVLGKDEGGRHTPFFNGYRPQFYIRTTDVTGSIELPEGVEMVMPGDNITMKIKLIYPVAMEKGLRFAIREGGRTVGAGTVSGIIE